MYTFFTPSYTLKNTQVHGGTWKRKSDENTDKNARKPNRTSTDEFTRTWEVQSSWKK